uniref:glycosyltransferase n=1 Tax=Umezakia ovalisporum TaxID=75695 RepID=UPI0039C71704
MGELIIKLLIHYLEITAPLLFWPGLVYLLMLFYSYRVLKTKFLKATSKKETEWPKVTVIVVTRNEAENLPNLLKALAGQTYQGRIESLIVDDGSTDGTAAIVAEYKPAEVFLKRYPAPPAGMSPKKWAITNAVQEANGDIIITTDADCVPTNQWLESMVAGLLADKSKKMVLGPVVLESSGTLLDNLQAQQFGAVMAVSFAFAEKGYPFSGSAANLVYYKNDFLAVGGYSGNAQKSG